MHCCLCRARNHEDRTLNRFEGASAVITGAGSGLGRDVAIALAREGAARVVLIDVDATGLQETREQVGESGQSIVCDVSDPDQVSRAWNGMDLPDALDVLITAAGTIGSGADIEHCTPQEWDRIFAVNVRGTYLAIRQALPHLRKRRGCIVTFGSTAGLAGSLALGAYSASKGAITMMTRSLALAHGAEGIRVNCVCPGSIDTPMLQATFDAAGDARAAERRKNLYLSRYPMERFGAAHEVTSVVLFLASREASYLTGVALPIDGGRLA
ncbi:MAG: SDR family NAD(P)-dependent oxidoreductase [Gammaproteobacteria bacterium]